MTGNPSEERTRSRLPWLLAVASLLAVPLLVIWWPGCRQYPAVTSREALVLMKLLYAACNTRDTQRLAEVEQRAEILCSEGKMTAAEKETFDTIIGLARAGKWQRAEDAAFKFAQDQVGVGHPDPDGGKHDHDNKGKAAKRK